MKQTHKIILVNAAVFLLLLFAIEGISRVLISKADTQALFSDEELRTRGRSFVQKDPVRGFALVPGFRNTLYTVNKEGFRGDAFPEDLEQRYRIIAMGESTTFGWDVADAETYPYYLMQQLRTTHPDSYVINGGVPSYTSAQVLAYMKEIFTANVVRPDMILVNIMWNDIWYSSVKNWHPDILIHQKPPSWLNFLTTHSYFFYGLVMGFGEKEKESDLFNQEAYEHYIGNLESMIIVAKANGSRILFVEPPFDADHMPKEGLSEFQIRYSRPFLIETARTYRSGMRKLTEKYGIPVISHRLDLDTLHQKPLFLDALHPTADGNRMMAEDIGKALSQSL